MMRPIRTALSGDVLTDYNGMWMVDDVKTTPNGQVMLKVRAGRTDRPFWTPPHDPDKPVDLYTPSVQVAP